MNDRTKEKIVDLLDIIIQPGQKTLGDIADYLIRNGVTVQEWISVDDELPEEAVNCIVHYRHAYCDNDGYWAIGFCCYDGEKFLFDPAYKVTHWMPMPNPPEMGKMEE